ncbi:acetyltransferase [Desulfosporosinus youngiae DSM 17734]|uniref:Acetyltransferase n=2 Tax=Desulfosporosinus TaxID=79206 RepID=H5Y512_9FIRM|nr:acetyltransferase [Desulfosporosinus youngiae DSM 17734]
MRRVRVTTLEHSSLYEITEMWNRCWRGYYYDMSYTHEHMKIWLELSHVSLRHSIAVHVNHQIVGFSLLSIDGRDGWIAGACIDPEYRRNGLFKVLMRTQLNMANYIQLKRVFLEVLEQNPARLVYQSVGFLCVRQLNVYRSKRKLLQNKPFEGNPLVLIPVEHYFKNRSQAFFNPAWQRREGYLRRHNNLRALINLNGTAGALFAGDKWGPLLDIWSADSAGAEEVLSTLLRKLDDPLTLINQPNDWIAALLGKLGINPNAKQIEMCVELS